jgi:ribosomal protein S18 acetylase RimI-like enzyme
MPSFELRAATLDDREAIFALYERLFRHHIDQIWGWDPAWQTANFAEEWRIARTKMIIAGGELSGYLQLKSEPDHDYILSLGIVPDSQGQGIGRRLMSDLKRDAAERSLSLRLSVFSTNPRALKFYETLGFRVTDVTPEFHRLEWHPG